jgi:NTE family protein
MGHPMTATADSPTTQADTQADRSPVLVDFALQGGGAHGAFTWGVLDRLLEEPWLQIDGISGTSAGAMNAAVLVDGYAENGAPGARQHLERYWRRIAEAARFSPFRRTPLDMMMGRWTLDYSPFFVTMDLMSRLYSPYDLNPRGSNPLRGILSELIDFERVAQAPIKLFITATNVRTGRGRVFRNAEITPDVLLASACLPTLFQAIEIEGEAYWDGGYSGNPTITPLVRECRSRDTILIPINPVERPGTPNTARDIFNRLNEVSFNAVLLKELRMIALLRQVADVGNSEGAQWAGMRIHLVRNEIMSELGYSSKLNAEWDFISMLHQEGRRAADAFLSDHADNIGKRSSVDLDVLLQGV